MATTKKAIETTFKKSTPDPKCPNCGSRNVVKAGVRHAKKKSTQRHLCNNCSKNFSTHPLKRTSYPPKIILTAVSLYNLGYTLEETRAQIRKRFKMDPRIPTIHSWLNRYQDICTFTNLRKRFTIDPNKIIQSKKFYHVQVYEFKFHTLKLNIAGKRYPELKNYIQNLPTTLDNTLFQKGPRISTLGDDAALNRPPAKPKRITKNNATKMTQFALGLVKKPTEKHEKVEDFFLINDSATIAIETPVYLTPKEAKTFGIHITQPLTGHIDILQVRQNRIHILDYKPDASSDTKAPQQLFLYALALHKRTQIPLKNITCAYFDENDYYQFTPTIIVEDITI